MLNTLNNDNNINIILELNKDPFPHYFFTLRHTGLQHVTLIKMESGFIYCSSGQEDVYIDIGSINKGFKAPPFYYRARPCRDWWKTRCKFTRVRY